MNYLCKDCIELNKFILDIHAFSERGVYAAALAAGNFLNVSLSDL